MLYVNGLIMPLIYGLSSLESVRFIGQHIKHRGNDAFFEFCASFFFVLM